MVKSKHIAPFAGAYKVAPISFSFIHTTRLSSVTQNVNDWVSKKVSGRAKNMEKAENKKTKWNEARQVHDRRVDGRTDGQAGGG